MQILKHAFIAFSLISSGFAAENIEIKSLIIVDKVHDITLDLNPNTVRC